MKHESESFTLYCGDSNDVLPTLEDNYKTTGLLADPPYGLGESNGNKHKSRSMVAKAIN